MSKLNKDAYTVKFWYTMCNGYIAQKSVEVYLNEDQNHFDAEDIIRCSYTKDKNFKIINVVKE